MANRTEYRWKADMLLEQLGESYEDGGAPPEQRMEILLEALVNGVLAITAPDVLDELEDDGK